MKIYGLQRLTLLDYPGKVACTVFTGGCNLRCPYCHNAPLVLGAPEEELSGADFFAFLQKRRGVLDGVCVSGGEPLLQPELPDFLRRIRELGFLVKLDTNGCFPDRLGEIVSRGLADYVAMDLKSSPEGYARAVGAKEFDFAPVGESIELLLSGRVDYEFRTTVVRELHDEAVLREAARTIRGARRYFLQRFVDSGELIAGGLTGYSDQEMRFLLETVSSYVEAAALRGL